MGVDRKVDHLQKEVGRITGPLYTGISPEERFRRVMEARAGEDEDEEGRLLKYCPRKTYTMRDAEVVERLQAVDTLTLCVCLDMAVPLGKLQMLKGQREALEFLAGREADLLCQAWYSGYAHGRAEGWRLAGVEGEPPESGEEDSEGKELPLPEDEGPAAEWFLGVNSRLVRDLETLVLEQWEAFSHCCREDLGLEPERVLQACMAPAVATMQKALGEMEGIQADPAKVSEHRDLLGRLWRSLAGLDPQ